PARSALKRIGPFSDIPAVRQSIEAVAKTPRAETLQPYLEWAAKSVDEAWADALFAHRHASAAETPAEETPAEEMPAEEMPAEEMPAEEMPAKKPWWKIW
ncbi:MAG: hypothetical protein AAFV53_19200, partial [Myxococcota bacterium]